MVGGWCRPTRPGGYSMVDVRPFAGLRYDPRVVGSLSDVLCPPYDIISVNLQEELHRRSPYNAVRLERGLALEGDNGGFNPYTRAADALASWRWEGSLVREAGPSYYLLRHRFSDSKSRPMERWGIIARVRLEEFDRRVILPHEETLKAPKEDRLSLMEACRANLSPVMALYRQGQGAPITAARERATREAPALVVQYEQDQELGMWVVDTAEFAEAVRDALKDAPLFIADGHHRYETALLYRDRVRARAGSGSGGEVHNYIMMTLIDFDDPGVLVLPYHRLVGGLDPPTFTAVRNRLLEVFQATAFPGQPTTPEEVVEAVAGHAGGGSAEAAHVEKSSVLGLLGPDGEGPYLLTLKGAAAPDGGLLRDFEGWVLQEAVLRHVLSEAAERHTTYTDDPREAWEKVLGGEQQMAFFLRPFPLDLFESVVSAGERLPPKSTYFYPKVPTGLVFHVLEGKS